MEPVRGIFDFDSFDVTIFEDVMVLFKLININEMEQKTPLIMWEKKNTLEIRYGTYIAMISLWMKYNFGISSFKFNNIDFFFFSTIYSNKNWNLFVFRS